MSEHPDSVRTGVNRPTTAVTGEKLDLAGTSNYYETVQPLGSTPSLYISVTTSTGQPVKKFLLEEVQYYMNPTAGETYQVFLLEDSSADDVQQYTDIVFWSPLLQADSVCYRYSANGYQAAIGTAEVAQYKLPRVVELATAGKLYYMMAWTGAPGDTLGFIKIRGRLLK
jgi:hypothetical protein